MSGSGAQALPLVARPMRQHGSACVLARCGVQSSSECVSPCGLPVSGCLATSVVRSRQGPCGLPRIFMFQGSMKAAAFVPSPSPGPWCARLLDSAVVDSRVWLPGLNSDLYRLCGSLHALDTFSGVELN